jgi:hypothetical protein
MTSSSSSLVAVLINGREMLGLFVSNDVGKDKEIECEEVSSKF